MSPLPQPARLLVNQCPIPMGFTPAVGCSRTRHVSHGGSRHPALDRFLWTAGTSHNEKGCCYPLFVKIAGKTLQILGR
jgi:hypothetical protein